MLRKISSATYQTILFICLIFTSFGQNKRIEPSKKLGFNQLLEKAPLSPSVFCVPNDEQTKSLLKKDGIIIKYETKNWLFITATPQWIHDKSITNQLKKYYFEYAPPMTLADSALHAHFVNPVHQGLGGLDAAYLGENVIIGYVDQGIDWKHPDFLDENGKTRVLRYWDHTTNTGGTLAQPYGYGIVWDSTAINNGSCTSTETVTAHGTTVAGMGSGNGRANGSNTGVAPKSNIIIVETNFDLPNWTLTIADACDYIFKVADTLGLPAVVNLSLGTYLGSHDGNDPASEHIESLLDEKNGRIVVCAAGNSGTKGKYHVHGDVDLDTSFVWIKNNPNTNGAFGANKIYFDLWSNLSDATFDYAFGADLPSPTFGFRGRTIFRGAQSSIDTPVLDTIFNANGNRIATIEVYTELIDGNYHMQVLFSNVDSTNYNFRIMTKGSGSYDLWSGQWMGLNDFVTSIPSSALVPEIIHYHMPDSLQTIVSSWNCSEKVISVGNIRNRISHINNNGTLYVSSDPTPPGKLSPGSSKGPNRNNIIKPDISAAGDFSLTAAPLWLLNNPGYNTVIDSGGWHARNGGTSMASPVVAGIAALYLEKCGNANYSNFKNDLISTALTDINTGSVPNVGYGYGKAHALNLMLKTEILPILPILQSGNTLASLSFSNYQWTLNGVDIPGETSQTLQIAPPYGTYTCYCTSASGCKTETPPFNVGLGIDEQKEKSISIHPNPTQDYFEIQSQKPIESVKIYDLNGKEFQLIKNSVSQFDISYFSKGIYQVVVKIENEIFISKIIKM